MYTLCATFPGHVNHALVSMVLEALTVANTNWYLRQSRARWPGPFREECCAKCYGIRWDPTPTLKWVGAPDLIKRKWGSCAEIVSLDVAIKRAKAMLHGFDSETATNMYRWRRISAGPTAGHVVMVTPEGQRDVCRTMERR